jgi:3-hydroxyisobutyrate dehydrogenase
MIGLIGVGRMGLPLCTNLSAAGYDVTAHDLRPQVREDVLACGARWAPTRAAAAAAAEILITVLPGPAEVAQVMLEPGGVLDALPPGATWVDMTSNVDAAAAPIRARASELGIDVLDAPVGGGVTAAREGSLKVFVGGEPEVLERCRAVLAVVGDPARLVHVGGPGAGYTTKLIVNLLWFGQAVATAEALLLGRRSGLDLDVLRGALEDSAARTDFITSDLDALFAGDYLTSFGLDRCCEELENITAQARRLEVPAELAETVTRVYERALRRYGPVPGELLAVALLEETTGEQLRTDR